MINQPVLYNWRLSNASNKWIQCIHCLLSKQVHALNHIPFVLIISNILQIQHIDRLNSIYFCQWLYYLECNWNLHKQRYEHFQHIRIRIKIIISGIIIHQYHVQMSKLWLKNQEHFAIDAVFQWTVPKWLHILKSQSAFNSLFVSVNNNKQLRGSKSCRFHSTPFRSKT